MIRYIILLLITIFTTLNLSATETRVMIRAQAKDAKFIGSSIGGAFVKMTNTLTGELMASGTTTGSTGNTKLIMNTAHERGQQLSDENTAGFLAVVNIDEPTFVTVEVHSPLNKKQATIIASTQLWLIPGKHILGDGVIIEIAGFVIDILKPRTHQALNLDQLENGKITIQANMVMMCGCTISKGGLWDSEKMEIKAIINKNGTFFKEIVLDNPDDNLLEGSFTPDAKGLYEVMVYAYDANTGNTGLDKVNFMVN